MAWLTVAAEESSTFTVGPNVGLVLVTAAAILLLVLILTLLVRWGRKPR